MPKPIDAANNKLFPLATQVIATLGEQGRTLALAESCTGGLIAKTLTDIAGASAVFVLSAVTYANEMKTRVLSVPPALLVDHGAVSAPCVRAMAEGVRALAGADLALAVSGIAGPEGGSPDKPVGTVWLAVSSAQGTASHGHTFSGPDRDTIRQQATQAALKLILLEGNRWTFHGNNPG